MNKNKKHWIVLAICCGLSASSIGICVNAAGVFYAPVAESLGVLRGTVALQTTFTILSMSIISLFAPKIMRKYRFKNLLWIHVLIAGFTTIAMALSKNILIFQFLGFIRGFSAGLFAVVPLTIIINHWFDKHHGLTTSIVLSFSGVAGAVLSPVFATCIESIGWEATYIVVGVLFIILCLPGLLIPFSVNPREEGLLPYGYVEKDEDDNTTTQTKQSFNFLQLSFICFFIFSILHTAITGITQHLPGFAVTMEYSASVGAMLLSAGMLGNIFYKLSIGIVSDRLGPLPASIIMIAINVVSIFLLLLWPINTGILLFSGFLFGSVYSVAGVGTALLTKQFFGNENYILVYPVVSFATGLGGAFSITLVGYIFDFFNSYTYAFIIALFIHAINIILLLIIIRVMRKKLITSNS